MAKFRRMSLRREFLLSMAALMLGAMLVVVAAVLVALPLLTSPAQVALFIAVIVVADLAVLFIFLRDFLQRALFGPLEAIGKHAESIAGGAYEHRIPQEGVQELDRLIVSLNTMAERLISEQEALAENVQSLDRTNQELVETTEELVRAARLASVGTLAAGLAHEVGNPLSALMGYLDFAASKAREGKDPTTLLDEAVEEAHRINRIIKSVLEFARPDVRQEGQENGAAGGDGGRGRPLVSITAAVDRAITLLEGRGALNGIQIHRQEETEGLAVQALPQHVEQVLLNLLMNAIRAVEDQDEPWVRIRLGSAPAPPRTMGVRRAEDPPGVDYSHRRRLPRLLSGKATRRHSGRDVVVAIEDNGAGVTADEAARLFDPFYTTRQPGEGTGMGLAITARIVEELGGEVGVENREEGGARFTVRLPEAETLAGEAIE